MGLVMANEAADNISRCLPHEDGNWAENAVRISWRRSWQDRGRISQTSLNRLQQGAAAHQMAGYSYKNEDLRKMAE